MTTFTGLSSITGLGSMSFGAPALDQVTGTTTKGAALFGDYFSPHFITTTGYCALESWDGSKIVVGSGNGVNEWCYFSVLIVAPYNTSSPKNFTIYSSDFAGNRSGNIIRVQVGSQGITAIDVTGCSLLDTFGIGQNFNLSSIDVAGLTELLSLDVNFCLSLSSWNISGCTSLISLSMANSPLAESLDFTDPEFANITTLGIYLNNFINLDLTPLSNLETLLTMGCIYLETIEISGLQNLNFMNSSDCTSLTSIRAVGVGAGMTNSFYSGSSTFGSGISLRNCALTASGLDQLYTDLDNGVGSIIVTGNPGVDDDSPGIATAKGFAVFGS